MNVVYKGRVGRYIGLRTLGAIALCIVFVILFYFLCIVAEIVRDEELDVTIVVNESATFGKAGDTVAEAERTVTAVHLIVFAGLLVIVAVCFWRWKKSIGRQMPS